MKINSQGIKIRKAGAADLRELQDIGIRSYLPHYTHLWEEGGVFWYMLQCFADEILQSELEDPNIEYYIAYDNNQSIGILKLVLQKPLPKSDIENALYLEKIYFVKEWTGKGAGRELMQIAFNRARELNRDCVWLMAMDTAEKPIAAYEKAGFTIYFRTRLDFEMMKKEYRGMIVMKKCFKDNEN